jgi:protein-tyrosine phosphatase
MLNEAKEKLVEQEIDTNTISLTNDRDSGVNYNDFDYEIDKPIDSSILTKINYHNNFPDQLAEKYYKCEPISIFSRNCLKEIVSEGRIRMHKRNFDLDLVYITRRIIAMGYPATGCESLYRNSFKDVKQFLYEEHGQKFKVYNLCMEENRIYKKTAFGGPGVSLFPFQDHQSCPVKLMLEFCIDVCLFLLKDDENVVAIHCKAGKGRTGTMICAYLLFTGLALNSVKAFECYGVRRSKVNKGVTVPSQRRYIQHFETYLSCNFQRPYFKLIPKIIRNYLTKPKGNLLKKIKYEKNYYNFNNRFIIKKIKIGPFTSKVDIDCKIIDFQDVELFNTENGYQYNASFEEIHDPVYDIDYYYYRIEITQKIKISSDINLSIFNRDIKMNSWVNLFFVTLENFIYIISKSKHKEKFRISNLRKKKRKRTITRTKNFFTSSTSSNNMLKNPFSMSVPKMAGIYQQKKLIEMNELDTSLENKEKKNINKNYFENNENEIIDNDNDNDTIREDEDEEEGVEFERCFDCNYFWINNIIRNEQKIINFIKMHTKFKGDNIENL